MFQFPIGVMLDSFRLPIREALVKAREVGAAGLQVYATSGEMAPENMNAADRAEFVRMAADHGLTIAALCGDIGGFAKIERNPSQIERSKRIMDLAKDLGCDVVTTHIGVIPDDPEAEYFKIYQDACNELGAYGESIGAHFAIETGPETCATLKKFLDSLDNRGVGVNFDPANLVMVTGDDPVAGVRLLGDYIHHTHAKDGVMVKPGDPMEIYHMVDHVVAYDEFFLEVPLGEGSVDWPNYLAALEEIGFRGFLTIEREVGDNPEADIRLAVEFLKRQLSS